MHTKSNPKIGYLQHQFAPAVVVVCRRPSTSPRRPWCQGHGDVLGRGHARRHGPGAKTMIILRKNHLRRPGTIPRRN